MTFPEFDTFMDELYAEIKGLRATKGTEYAHSADRFANFNRAAERKKVDRLTVAGIFLDKHLDAIDSFIQTKKIYSEPIRGRFKDAILYLFLQAGMAQEDEDRIREEQSGGKYICSYCKTYPETHLATLCNSTECQCPCNF